MHIAQAAKYFDLADFQNWDFTANQWAAGYFKGQYKVSDKFQTIYHRPTRKRMLYTAGNVFPSSSVIRVVATGDIFMVGARQPDVFKAVWYRNVWSLHEALGVALINRSLPIGPANNPGWAVSSLVATTFGDIELRSLNENQEEHLIHRGQFILTLPNGSLVERDDIITLNSRQYQVLERYIDSSMVNCRVIEQGDDRINVVYRQHTGQSYVEGVVTETYNNRNITARISSLNNKEVSQDISANAIKMMVSNSFLGTGFTPGLDDEIVVDSITYKVNNVYHDVFKEEWHIIASF